MSFFGIRLTPSIALAVTTILCSRASAQAVAPRGPHHLSSEGEVAAIDRRPLVLRSSYKIRLTSAWPQLRTSGGECVNGGQEVLEGVLTRSADGRYTGVFTRLTGFLFCGVHATAVEACQLSLAGSGEVEAVAQVYRHEEDSVGQGIALSWRPDPERSEVRITGSCIKTFEDRLEAMYLSALHQVEFTLPWAGSGPQVEDLEDYGWVVEID
jgi:hypothetical protein